MFTIGCICSWHALCPSYFLCLRYWILKHYLSHLCRFLTPVTAHLSGVIPVWTVGRAANSPFQISAVINYPVETITYPLDMCSSVPVAQWFELCVSSTKVVGSIPREHTYWQYKCIAWMHCKSLWIKASAKCINVNMHLQIHSSKNELQKTFKRLRSVCFFCIYSIKNVENKTEILQNIITIQNNAFLI